MYTIPYIIPYSHQRKFDLLTKNNINFYAIFFIAFPLAWKFSIITNILINEGDSGGICTAFNIGWENSLALAIEKLEFVKAYGLLVAPVRKKQELKFITFWEFGDCYFFVFLATKLIFVLLWPHKVIKFIYEIINVYFSILGLCLFWWFLFLGEISLHCRLFLYFCGGCRARIWLDFLIFRSWFLEEWIIHKIIERLILVVLLFFNYYLLYFRSHFFNICLWNLFFTIVK